MAELGRWSDALEVPAGDDAFAVRVRDGRVSGRIRVIGQVPGLHEAARTRVGEVTVRDALPGAR